MFEGTRKVIEAGEGESSYDEDDFFNPLDTFGITALYANETFDPVNGECFLPCTSVNYEIEDLPMFAPGCQQSLINRSHFMHVL